MPSVASRKSLLGVDTGYGYGHYNQAHDDGSFSPVAPPARDAYPSGTFADPAGVDPDHNQGYAYRQGLTPSQPATSAYNGKVGFISSRWPAAYLAVSALQAILCISFEAYVFAKTQSNLSESRLTHSNKDARKEGKSEYLTIPTFLTLFIFGFLYTLVIVWDALRLKNTIQAIGVCFSNLALMIYTAIQVDQVHTSLVALNNYNLFKAGVQLDNVWSDVKPYLVTIPAIIAAATVVMMFLSWKVYQEYAWDILKTIGADYRMKKRYLHYQIYIALLKFDFFFFLGFIIQFVVIVSDSTDPEFYLTIVTIPICILILLAAAWFVRRENKFGMVVVIILYLGGLSYFIFKCVRIYEPKFSVHYKTVAKSLTAFAIITILLIVLTIINAIVCMLNFNKGLRPHLESISRKTKDDKPDGSISMQDVKPTIPSRMTID